ncbi:MAG TPA: DUF3226 domain-containing protein [Candidatus Hodarchaeales archaeon]|nr:DUF3226 domain-containing protein [Candidatus Hodarchaeales archaeon]
MCKQVDIMRSKLLLVEGRSLLVFLLAFLKHLDITDVQIIDFKGITQLKQALAPIVRRPQFLQGEIATIGIIRDAEENAFSALQSVQTALRNVQAGLQIPNTIASFEGTNPRIGIFILPDGRSPGMLESLCLSAISDLPVAQCIDAFFVCINDLAGIQQQGSILVKSRAQAYLASVNAVAWHIGEAAQMGIWDFTHPSFTGLRGFLRSL